MTGINKQFFGLRDKASSSFGDGNVIQFVENTDNAVSSGTAQFPNDDSIPQSSEGISVIDAPPITPISASNKLRIRGSVNISSAASNNRLVFALFTDDDVDALFAVPRSEISSNLSSNIDFEFILTADTTKPITFKIRVGTDTSSVLTINGVTGARKYGGVLESSITVEEMEQ